MYYTVGSRLLSTLLHTAGCNILSLYGCYSFIIIVICGCKFCLTLGVICFIIYMSHHYCHCFVIFVSLWLCFVIFVSLRLSLFCNICYITVVTVLYLFHYGCHWLLQLSFPDTCFFIVVISGCNN